MKFITNYKELGGDSSESVLSHITKTHMEGKEKILAYLKNGENRGVRCSAVFDHIRKESQLDTIHLFTDGEYCWDSEEIYHFEKYNLSLDAKFIQKVFSKSRQQ